MNKKNNIEWCSIEQSKKLVDLGLSPETADMYYPSTLPKSGKFLHNPTIGSPCEALKWYNLGYTKSGKIGVTFEEFCIPCWSLGALIGLLPKTIETKKPKNLYFPEILPSNNCVAYTALNERKEMVFLKMFATGTESDATLIDNMVSMICWLLKNNYIKKKEIEP